MNNNFSNFNNLYRNMYAAMNNNSFNKQNTNQQKTNQQSVNQQSMNQQSTNQQSTNQPSTNQPSTNQQVNTNINNNSNYSNQTNTTDSQADHLKNIKGISPEKLKLISDIIKQSETVSSENLVPFFLNAASTANANGITFSDQETDLIIESLKTNMSSEQITKLETVRKLANIISAGKTN